MSLVFEKNNSVAVAVTDISTGDFFTYKTKLSDIENEIIKYKPGEVLICQDNFCDDKLKKVFEKFNITSTVLKNIDFDPAYCEKTIKQILKVHN